jgi:hypothetical protein
VRKNYKFGIQVPSTVKEALQIDKDTSTTFWHDVIQKEMKNNSIAFEFLEAEDSVLVGYKKITLHMIFDVKIGFTHKACLDLGDTLLMFLLHLPTPVSYQETVCGLCFCWPHSMM